MTDLNMELANGESSTEVYDITQCPLCLETHKNPKTLPCNDTICLQCLDKLCVDRKPEDLACPICKKSFVIPAGGITDLPDNLFIIQLIRVKRSMSKNKKKKCKGQLCELCSSSDADVPATSYCVECGQSICDQCSAIHKKSKISMSHQVVRDDDLPCAEKRIKLSVSYCDEHIDERNRMYCDDCKTVSCLMCFTDKHDGHKWTEVNKAAEKFRELLKEDVDNVSKCASMKKKCIKQLESDMSQFMEKVTQTREEISRQYDKMKSLIQSQRDKLDRELDEFQDQILVGLYEEKTEITRQHKMTETLKKYCLAMMNDGKPCDVSRNVHDLRAEVQKFMELYDESSSNESLSGVEITFKPSLSMDTVKNFIGELVLKDKKASKDDSQELRLTKFLGKSELLHTIHMPNGGKPILSMTVIGTDVFAVRATTQVDVYNSDDFALKQPVQIGGANQLMAVASCSQNNCLYISDPKSKILYRYDPKTGLVNKWLVSGASIGLSITKNHNVLVSLYNANRIQEYSTNGVLIREVIFLDSRIEKVRHCVQLSTGNYVVCHEGAEHRVCIVDDSGRSIVSYGGAPGSGPGQLNCPVNLAVDICDNVLVTNCRNNEVLLLNDSLSHLGHISIPGHLLTRPYSLYFDKLSRRLYIGQLDRVLILGTDNKDNKD